LSLVPAPRTEEDIQSDITWLREMEALKNNTLRRYAARSNRRNNHDDQKQKHTCQEEAEAEISRMRRNNYADSDRLNAYYNYELQGWFVGRSKNGY
jgi:hypothetical protein